LLQVKVEYSEGVIRSRKWKHYRHYNVGGFLKYFSGFMTMVLFKLMTNKNTSFSCSSRSINITDYINTNIYVIFLLALTIVLTFI